MGRQFKPDRWLRFYKYMSGKYCKNCNNLLITRKQNIFCSNKCQSKFNFEQYIFKWKNNKVSGEKGINTKGFSGYIRKYILDKYDLKCARCGWNEINPLTKRSPLEIEHIDGDSNNNRESNLILLCPNCHSLTTSFKNLNKGNGRKWRKDKYKLNSNL